MFDWLCPSIGILLLSERFHCIHWYLSFNQCNQNRPRFDLVFKEVTGGKEVIRKIDITLSYALLANLHYGKQLLITNGTEPGIVSGRSKQIRDDAGMMQIAA